VHMSRRGPDVEHPFGHGKELYFWSLVVAIVLFGLGGGMSLYEGITHIIDPVPLRDPGWNFLVLGIAFVLEGSSLTIAARRIAREAKASSFWHAVHDSKDPSVVTVLLEDAAAIAGLTTAGIGILLADRLADPRIDGVASVIIGLILAAVAVYLAYECRGLLIGERADPRLIDRLRSLVLDDPAVEHIDRIRSMHIGPSHIVVTLRVRFAARDASEVADAARRVEARLRELDERLTDVTLQAI
jgi:cation diffusion facilitator family transporter